MTADYEKYAWWWEPLEMCRKLALTGWVMLLDEKAELARTVVALLVSVAVLALQLAIQPLKRYVCR